MIFILELIVVISGGRFIVDFGVVFNGWGDYFFSGFGFGVVFIIEFVVICFFFWLIFGIIVLNVYVMMGFVLIVIGFVLMMFYFVVILVSNVLFNLVWLLVIVVYGGLDVFG